VWFLGPQELKILDGAQDFTILTCSEIKKISDIRKLEKEKTWGKYMW
jgi:hypothetical protein